jgi:predicted PurR-regulated permease PerM
MPTNIDSPLARRMAALAFLVFIFGATFWVLSPFFASLAWAGILAYVTWPLHLRVQRYLPQRDNIAALLMTLLAVGVTVRAVVFGIVLTALAQGVLGGLKAFGLIGLFLGPVLLAVSVALWREWLIRIDAPK